MSALETITLSAKPYMNRANIEKEMKSASMGIILAKPKIITARAWTKNID